MRRRFSGIGCGIPRARFVTSHSGCAGAPPGPITRACQELADGGRQAKSEAAKERLTQKVP